ncbi:glucose-6-phosphate 1-dehydrogenase 4, chloroplastic isoform X3 [Durio zibethinus]|uniref:Glucose-6-phosphate 1-dehydrogenase 4, chloroplastic isoform X3 n=1 Tax=Durio zibethinus TaxID=66656 RepID=A0A6P5WU05_DURZI|nr:glucose-6-phosphate 1-dehydrogenase 4, chloroplastic isoform X3 [Durio zibethinus]
MAVSFSHISIPFQESSIARSISLLPYAANNFHLLGGSPFVLYGGAGNFCWRFHDLKRPILKRPNIQQRNRKHVPINELISIRNQNNDQSENPSRNLANDEQFSEAASTMFPNDSTEEQTRATSHRKKSSMPNSQPGILEKELLVNWLGRRYSQHYLLYITVVFFLRQNCGDKMDAFLSRTYYLNGGYDNKEGMSKLNALMEQIEGGYRANRIFYLSVPQEALLDVASSLADNAQTKKGWNRIIIEKPFGFDALSSQQFTKSLLSKFKEKQIYRIDHLLGRNLIENLTVLRFSNLVFEPLWSRTYIRNVQVILSEDMSMQIGRYFDGYGVIRDIVHSHMLQTIALLAMEPPISLDGEDIRNEKVKVLRSIRKLELSDVILGQYKATSADKLNVSLCSLTPTFFAAALYIDNARWDGVPFLIKAGVGLIKHRAFYNAIKTYRVEIRIQFNRVPGNLYRECIGHNTDLATNELILRDVPDEAILVKINNKIPGLGLQLDASELNLLYKDKYNVEVPDSYEHLLLDVMDGDNHLFLRSDELAAAWSILTPVLQEVDQNNIAPELYELGGRGPVGAYYLWAKHGVRWADD